MCQSKEERSPWLAIDYGTPVIVQRVEIFNRDDCCGGRTKNVEVWISNHLLRTRNLLGTFVGPATDGQRITISGWRAYCTNYIPYWYIVNVAGVRTKIDISGRQDVSSNSVQALSGRYVTVLMNNGDNVPLNLKEVRAYGKAGRRFGLYVCKPQSFIDWEKRPQSVTSFWLLPLLSSGRNRRTESSSAYKRLEEPRRKFVFSSIGPENR